MEKLRKTCILMVCVLTLSAIPSTVSNAEGKKEVWVVESVVDSGHTTDRYEYDKRGSIILRESAVCTKGRYEYDGWKPVRFIGKNDGQGWHSKGYDFQWDGDRLISIKGIEGFF